MSNTIKTMDGVEVYTDKIFQIVDDYIETELNGDETQIKDKNRMMDLIFYIRDRIPYPKNDDIKYMDWLFNNIYIRLCSKYNTIPTLEQFSFIADINTNTFSAWGNGEYRSSSPHGLAVKRWKETCKRFLLNDLNNKDGASVNKIFIAKAVYGLSDNVAQVPVSDRDQIQSIASAKADFKRFQEAQQLNEIEQKEP